MRRVAAGFCTVRNPFRQSQEYRVSLAPADVRALFFWTRWPLPMVPHIDELEARGLPSIFHVTLTGLPAPLEPTLRREEERLEAIRLLAGRIGPARVWWRYDPIILGENFTPEYHVATFSRLSKALQGATSRVTLSLVDWYRKTERRVGLVAGLTGDLHRLSGSEPAVLELVGELARIARSHGQEPVSCCEPSWEAAGLRSAPCIDGEKAAALFGFSHEAGRDPGQRPDCRCSLSYDIGATDTCIGGCLYCYGTRSHEKAMAYHSRHDTEAEVL